MRVTCMCVTSDLRSLGECGELAFERRARFSSTRADRTLGRSSLAGVRAATSRAIRYCVSAEHDER